MKIAGEYSFNNGMKAVRKKYPSLLEEIRKIIATVNAKEHKTKSSREKTMPGRMLIIPPR